MVKGFIIYSTYDVREETVYAQYYGRLENNQTFLIEREAKPYFYIKTSDEKQVKKLFSELEQETTSLKSLNEEAVSKVYITTPKEATGIRNTLHDHDIQTFEADIRFAQQQLITNNIQTTIELSGTYEKGEFVDRTYTNPTIKPTTYKQELIVASIDIEANLEPKTLWSVAISTNTGEQHALIVNKHVPNAKNCSTEKELLEELTKLTQQIDPDIITGWNVIDFDLVFLQEKYKEHNLSWAWGRSNRSNKLRIESDYYRESSADITGRMVLDGIHLLKWNFVDLDSYSLDATAKHYLQEGKIFSGENKVEHIQESYKNNPEELIKYNLKDTQLVLDILKESTILELTITRSLLTGLHLDRIKASIASLDMLYLPELHKRGYVAPTSGYTRKEEPITGGFVMESKPGIYKNIIVCDFKSLYPSIMRTLNIDPLSFDPNANKTESDEEHVRAENNVYFRQEEAILPEILTKLLRKREEARKQGDELARFAIKILMNSFFGVLASPNCRFFSMQVANAITTTGQHLIQTAAKHIQDTYGYEVIYQDTDSAFINPNIEDSQKAQKIGEEIEQETNAFFSEYTKKRYCRESKLEIEFEKLFVRFLMPQTRSGVGSKKRYAGLLPNQEIDVTGLELVRRDWTDLAKEVQQELLNLVFKDKQPHKYLTQVIIDLREGKLDDKLIYTKALRKHLEAYTKTTPPHVKAARLMKTLPQNNLIEYVMTVDGPEPATNVQHSVDYEHYIDKQITPVADAILIFYNTTLSDVLKGTSQTTLF
ncbi:MAG: DNA polymerase II [Candidatus Woesearchaeota archaeon]